MARFTLFATRIRSFDNGCYSMDMTDIMNPLARQTVEAANIKELQPLYNAFKAEQEATGVCAKIDVRVERGFRKPPGFDKATNSGGSLYGFVNVASVGKDEAPADYRPEEDGPDWGKLWSDTSAELR